jgi:hypothetical protein
MKATTATSLEPSNLFSAFSEDTLPGVSLSTLMRLIFTNVRKEMLKTPIIIGVLSSSGTLASDSLYQALLKYLSSTPISRNMHMRKLHLSHTLLTHVITNDHLKETRP